MSNNSPSPRHTPSTERRAVRTQSHSVDVDALLDILNDENARAILEEVADCQQCAMDLAEACDISLSTTYRKLDELAAAGLVDEQLDVHSSGNNISRYTLSLDTVRLSLTDDEFEVEISHHE